MISERTMYDKTIHEFKCNMCGEKFKATIMERNSNKGQCDDCSCKLNWSNMYD